MKKNKNIGSWIIGGALLLIIIILLSVFIRQYQSLGKAIEEERSTYVSEIKNQLVKNIQAEKEQQITLVNIFGQLLVDLRPQRFETVNNILSNKDYSEQGDEIFLMDTLGTIYTLKKEQKTLSAQDLSYALVVDKKSVFGYSQVNLGEEFWIYGAPIEPLIIEEIEICAVISARSIENFGARMSTSILNNNGFSYIMSKSGNVLLYPSVESEMGYNLFHTLEASNIDGDIILKIRNDFTVGKAGKQVLNLNGNKWLIDYVGDMFDDWVVLVTMPMTITGADTYKMLNLTMIWVLLLFSSIVCFMVFVVRIFYIREQERVRNIHLEKAELAIAQRIAESKNEFLAKMSHDIRTPLNAIIGLIQITDAMVLDRPDVSEKLNQAGKSAEYLLGILNDILDVSKIESGKMELHNSPLRLIDLIESIKTINLVQTEKKKISFMVETDGDMTQWYLGDRRRIAQIMMNLLSNAIKFTKPGGQVLFSVKVNSTDNNDLITFKVKDTGVGMSNEFLNHLFDPFEQELGTQYMNDCGSGLGLTIVKNLTDLMNGTIEVNSKKDEGSTFIITLSLPRTNCPKETNTKELMSSLEGARVLLAEDNHVNAIIAKTLLEKNGGLIVETVENGQEALESFMQSEKGYFKAILMDIRMPVMDGLTATCEIRKSEHPDAKTIPIIAMSANAFDEDINKALVLGMNAYLSKPVDIKKTLSTLAEQIKEG